MTNELFQQERREQVVALLAQRVSVTDLSEQFGVSRATMRADLDALAAEHLLARTQGGALALNQDPLGLSFEFRRRLHTTQKSAIGAAAAAMIEDGEAIVPDASTTALAVATQIKDRRELTVLTNGIFTTLELLEAPAVIVLMPGGFLRRDSASTVGDEELTLEGGLIDANSAGVAIKRDLVPRARQVIAIVDSSKWDELVSLPSPQLTR